MSKASNRRDKLAELKALRASGKKAFDAYEVQQEADLYEEVDENQYKKIVRERLNQDDFVVDDNGEGYADDGREEWDRIHQYDSDSEDERVIKGQDRKAGKPYPASPHPTHRLATFPLRIQQISGNGTRTRPREMRTIATSASILRTAALSLSRNPR